LQDRGGALGAKVVVGEVEIDDVGKKEKKLHEPSQAGCRGFARRISTGAVGTPRGGALGNAVGVRGVGRIKKSLAGAGRIRNLGSVESIDGHPQRRNRRADDDVGIVGVRRRCRSLPVGKQGYPLAAAVALVVGNRRRLKKRACKLDGHLHSGKSAQTCCAPRPSPPDPGIVGRRGRRKPCKLDASPKPLAEGARPGPPNGINAHGVLHGEELCREAKNETQARRVGGRICAEEAIFISVGSGGGRGA
jgi:hypothetical protein